MTANPLIRLGQLGQSTWLDYITRDLVESGELRRLIEQDGLRGMTTNPTIFEKAVAGSEQYDEEIRVSAARDEAPEQIFEALAIADVRRACDLFRPVYDACEGHDGLVSLEVSPRLAYDSDGTVRAARRLWQAVDRPNLMIKIPGTREGLSAVHACLARGINVNITLLFAVERYRDVIETYFAALESRVGRGEPIKQIASVASFFVSRVDGKVDPALDKLGGEDAKSLRGAIAIANAAVAYETFERAFQGSR